MVGVVVHSSVDPFTILQKQHHIMDWSSRDPGEAVRLKVLGRSQEDYTLPIGPNKPVLASSPPSTISSPSSSAGAPPRIDGACDNLIVNYLPASASEESLIKIFSPFGNIIHCKIVKDFATGVSCGYGFVRFEDAEAATCAMLALNGYRFEHKRLKVSFAHPSPAGYRRANLYISGLPLTFSKHDLRQLFEPYGPIVETKILTDRWGKSKGVGFCRLEDRQKGAEAVRQLNGIQLEQGGAKITVKFADTGRRPKDRLAPGPRADPEPTDSSSSFSSSPPLDNYSNRWGTYVLSKAPGPEAVVLENNVCENFKKLSLGSFSSALAVDPIVRRSSKGVSLLISDMPGSWSEFLVYQMFSSYGEVINVEFIRNQDSKWVSRNSAVVKMESFLDALNVRTVCQLLLNDI